jgi:hypothetical protein
MDLLVERHLNREDVSDEELEQYHAIYQQLCLAWEYLGLQCSHGQGYQKIGDGKEACRICGKLKGIDESFILLPSSGRKRIGRKKRPSSKRVFQNEKAATLVKDSIEFHGAKLSVHVHNAYKSKLLGGSPPITIAADRSVKMRENGVKCSVDQHVIDIRLEKSRRKGRNEYGGFPWEIRKNKLRNFPVILRFDDEYRFLGLTILRSRESKGEEK